MKKVIVLIYTDDWAGITNVIGVFQNKSDADKEMKKRAKEIVHLYDEDMEEALSYFSTYETELH